MADEEARTVAHMGEPAPEGEEALHDRGAFALWYLRLRLEQELDRSQRAPHSFSLVLLAPNPRPGHRVSDTALAAAVAAVKASTRRSDLVGWFDKWTFAVLIFDGDEEGARQAALRWKNQIWLKTMHLGAVRWEASVVVDASQYASANEVFDAAREGLPLLLR